MYFLYYLNFILAGDAGLEPADAGVKVPCLTDLANPHYSARLSGQVKRLSVLPAHNQDNLHLDESGRRASNPQKTSCLEGRRSTN